MFVTSLKKHHFVSRFFLKNDTRMLGRALGRRRRPPRVRRLRRMRRDHRRRMAPVCLLSVFATRRHGRKPLHLFMAKQSPRRPAATASAQQHMPPATRPPCAHALTTHMPEDRRCRFVGGRRRTAQGRGLPSTTERFTVTASGRLQRRQALPPGQTARPRHRPSAL